MTHKEKADEIVNSVSKEISFYGQSKQEVWEDAKNISLICINQIIEALEDYGRDTDELQNMENIFRYWEKVKSEILK